VATQGLFGFSVRLRNTPKQSQFWPEPSVNATLLAKQNLIALTRSWLRTSFKNTATAMSRPQIPSPREFAQLLRIAWPLVLAQLAQNSLTFIDTMMVGRLGEQSLAGIAIGGTVFFFVVFIFSGMLLAVGPMVSQAIGASNPAEASLAAQQGLWLSIFMVPLTACVFMGIPPWLVWSGQTPETTELATGYLLAISWGLPAKFGLFSLKGFLEGHSDTTPVMLICFLGVAMNVIANQILIFGWGWIPAMGLVGTGYASAIVYTTMFLAMAAYIRVRYSEYPVISLYPLPQLKTILEIVKIGAPIGFTIGSEIGLFSTMAFLIGTFGTEPLAAHQIAIQSASISFMIPLGIGMAASIRIGNAIGKGSRSDAAAAGYAAMLIALAYAIGAGLIFWFLPEAVLRLYFDIDNPENAVTAQFAISFLRVAAMFQLVDAIQVVASCCLRGLKDTRAAMLLSLISYWGIGLAACLLLSYTCNLGPIGFWYGIAIALGTAAVAMTTRFYYQVR